TFTPPSTANTWQTVDISLVQDLPAGTYALVGAEVYCANGIAARFVPVGGGFRPGVFPKQDKADYRPPIFKNGKLGEWFRFSYDQLPKLECLVTADASGTTGEVFMQLMAV
ncbi:MAG: hypothetical protein ACTSQ8_24735, partial [Candidatus Helarchaeota archaeon]